MAIPEQPFGFVAGRWVLSLADTPMDSDRAPDYKPLYPGSVIFNNKLSHRVVTDGSETVGIVKTRYEASLNEEGRIIDAEEHEFVALPVGVYSVTFSFGQYSWPNFDIEVKAEHTIDSPLWLPSKSPIPAGPGVVHVVSEEARLAAEAAAASAWEAVDTPGRQGIQGIQGPPGDLDAEQLAGAPRLTNLLHGITWGTFASTIDSQTDRTVTFTATGQSGRVSGPILTAGSVYYFTGEVKATSISVSFGVHEARIQHSGSGDWERLTGLSTPSGSYDFQVRDTRPSGFDQIEVRDPVLIDLTAAFGAGREPTKEYMDALLAKHGHYIGAVDQFAFGDALQALTVAGPGMTLRHDTSVGERVFLDHPGGSTMLYGDTGWRDIQHLLAPGWKITDYLGQFKVRLTTDLFHMSCRIQPTLDAEFIGTPRSARRRITTIPSGFRLVDSYVTMQTALLAAGSPITIDSDGGAIISVVDGSGDWLAYDQVRFQISIPRQMIWPTALPGTPV